MVFHKKGGDQLQNRYHSDELDELVEQARRSMDVEERVAIYQKAEDKLVEDAPCMFLYHSWGMAPHRPEVMGMKLSLTPPMVRPEHLWIGKENH